MPGSLPTRHSTPRVVWWCVVAVCVGMLAVLLWPVWTRTLVTTGDLGDWTIPTRRFFADCLARGDSPLWFPHVLCGFDLHGEGQAGLLHPLHQLLYRVLPVGDAIGVETAIGYPALMLGTALFLRRLGVVGAPAWFGGLAFAFGGFCMRHYHHVNGIETIAHYPWALLALDGLLRGTTARGRALCGGAFALLTASALLMGYPQYFWFGSLVEVGYALFVAGVSFRRLAPVVVFKSFGLALAAVQLLPTFAALQESVRHATSSDYRYVYSLHPLELLQLVSPRLFENRYFLMYPPRLYPGAAVVALLLWLWIRRRSLEIDHRRFVRAATAFCVVCGLLMLGRYGLIFDLQLQLPVVGSFRSPYRYAVLVELVFALLAAIALQDLCAVARSGQRSTWRQLAPLLLLPVAGALVLLLVTWLQRGEGTAYLERQAAPFGEALLGWGFGAGATLCVVLAARGRVFAVGLLVVIGAVDLGRYGFQHVFYEPPVSLDDYVDDVPEPPPMRPGERAVAAVANQLALRDVRSVDGYMQLRQDRPFDRHVDELGPRSAPHLRIATVRQVQREPSDNWRGKARYRWALRMQSREWERVEDTLPRVRLVSDVVAVADRAAADAAVETLDVERQASVESDVGVLAGPPGEVTLTADRPGHIVVDVGVSTRQLLVLAESWAPGWVARVGGEAREVHRVYGTFLGVVVEPGDEGVVFEFAPRALRIGWWVTLVSLLGLIVVVAWLASGRSSRRVEERVDGA